MKVDIPELRNRLNYGPENPTHASINKLAYELNGALNELERYRNDNSTYGEVKAAANKLLAENNELKVDRDKYRDMLTRKELEIERLNGIIETMRTETSPFETLFNNHRPETIESVTFTFRKKEN